MTPGFDEARTLVQRLGPALSLHVAEYIVLNALFLAKDESFGGRAVPTVLAGPSVDASMAVRHIAELHELHERDPKAFARLDRIYRKQRRAGAKAKQTSTPEHLSSPCRQESADALLVLPRAPTSRLGAAAPLGARRT